MYSIEVSVTVPSARRQRTRHGTSSLEVLVAFSLLTTILGVATPLVARHGRLLTAHRQYRLALDELSNQLERLTALPADELSAAMEHLAPSDLAKQELPGVALKGELVPEDIGTRVTVRIAWDEPGRGAAPLELSGWSVPRAQTENGPMEAESP